MSLQHVSPPGGPLELLIVDDEPAVLSALERVIRPAGYLIHTAANGKEALSVLSKHNIAVVVTDNCMPEMSGADLLRYIHQYYPSIVTMMLSGEGDFETVVELLNNGLANKFLTKPWSNSSLVSEIEQAFAQYNARREDTWTQRIRSLKASLEQREEQAQSLQNVVPLEQYHTLVVVKLINFDDIGLSHGTDVADALDNLIVERIRSFLKVPCRVKSHDHGLFAIFFSETDVATLDTLCSDMRRYIQKSYSIEKNTVFCHVGVGYRITKDSPFEFDILIKSLELAILREVNRVSVTHLDDLTIEKYQRQQNIRNDLQYGLNHGEFKLAYQPKVSLKNGLIEGAEVLLRWHHRTMGWVPPSEFVRLAELDGQIEAIGDWVLKNSIRSASELVRFSPDITSVSINVSVRQLQSFHIVEVLKKELERYSLNPAFVELEITETAIAENSDFMNNLLWQLKLLGVRISIDDFGAGYTSLSYLAKLPVDVLKLDKSLVDHIDSEPNKRELVKSLINSAHRLEMDVVAEGVETTSVLDCLKRLQCDRVQGFIYSKAVCREDFQKLVVQQPFRPQLQARITPSTSDTLT